MSGSSPASDDRIRVPRDARGKRPRFYAASGVDEAMAMIMVLANELAVVHDRLDAAERVAKAAGLDLASGIETLSLDAAALEAREAWRQDFLDRLFYLQRKDASEAAAADSDDGYRATIAEIALG